MSWEPPAIVLRDRFGCEYEDYTHAVLRWV